MNENELKPNEGGSKVPIKRMNGAHVPHRKNTSEMAAVRIPVPKQLVIPMSMHIGAPAKPVVKPGEDVKV